jgi:hypothetical protein
MIWILSGALAMIILCLFIYVKWIKDYSPW